MWLPSSGVATAERDDAAVLVHVIGGRAYVEIAPGYLLWIAPEHDVRRELTDSGRLALATDAVERHMVRGLVIRKGELVIPAADTVH